jgi:transposase
MPDAVTTVAYVGLDIGQLEAVACFLLADGREPVERWAAPNTAPGAEALARQLGALAQQHGIRELRIGLEATNLYWWHLACALQDAPALQPYRPRVYALNPRLVRAFRAHYGALPKTDRADAFLIAERVRFGRQLPAPFRLDLRYAPLQRLTRFRVHVAHSLAREKSYFLTFLFLKFSAFGQAAPFTDPFGAASCAVLDAFTTEELAQAALPTLADYLAEKGRGHFKDPAAVAATLRRAAQDSYQLDKALAEPVTLVLGSTMATIRALQAQLTALDRTIARELKAIPQTLESVPGLGPVWTAGLIAEIGDIARFPDDASLAQYAGLTGKAHESGRFQAEDTALTKTGNTYLRYHLVEAANSVRVHCPEYRAYYRAKYAQALTHPHKRALVLTARKLVRLVAALLRSDSRYRAPELPQDQREVPAARNRRPGRQRRHRLAPAVA